jgi:hypothetical protein
MMHDMTNMTVGWVMGLIWHLIRNFVEFPA